LEVYIVLLVENARSTKNWTGQVPCFTAETDRLISTGPRLRPRSHWCEYESVYGLYYTRVGSTALSTFGENVASNGASGDDILNGR